MQGLYGDLNEERWLTFLDAVSPELEEPLKALESEAREQNIPLVRRDTQKLLRILLAIKCPKRILEIGAASGFSAILMAACSDCPIDTIENYAPRIALAKANIARANMAERITLYEGDAEEILLTFEEESYDFVFIDAAKGQYPAFWEQMQPLLNKKALVVADNILQEGDTLESRYAVKRRDRTIHARMRTFLYEVLHDRTCESTILPVGDGVLVAAKIR